MSEYYCSHQPPCCPQVGALKTELEKMTEDRERWADSACRLEKVQEKFQAEIARLRGEFEAMKEVAVYHDSRAVRFGKEADHWKSLAARLLERMKLINGTDDNCVKYGQGICDNHSLIHEVDALFPKDTTEKA